MLSKLFLFIGSFSLLTLLCLSELGLAEDLVGSSTTTSSTTASSTTTSSTASPSGAIPLSTENLSNVVGNIDSALNAQLIRLQEIEQPTAGTVDANAGVVYQTKTGLGVNLSGNISWQRKRLPRGIDEKNDIINPRLLFQVGGTFSAGQISQMLISAEASAQSVPSSGTLDRILAPFDLTSDRDVVSFLIDRNTALDRNLRFTMGYGVQAKSKTNTDQNFNLIVTPQIEAGIVSQRGDSVYPFLQGAVDINGIYCFALSQDEKHYLCFAAKSKPHAGLIQVGLGLDGATQYEYRIAEEKVSDAILHSIAVGVHGGAETIVDLVGGPRSAAHFGSGITIR